MVVRRASADFSSVGMAQVKSHIMRIQNASKPGENGWSSFRNFEVLPKLISSYSYAQKYRMYVYIIISNSPALETALIGDFRHFRVIMYFT